MSFEFEQKKLINYLGKSLVKTLESYKAFVAGGSITSLFCNRDINDVDIYFRNKSDAAKFIKEVITDKGWIVTHTKKATLFKLNDKMCQAIHFDYFSNPEDIFNKFDFTVCMGAYDFETGQFVLHPEFLKHNSQRILKFNENTAYPIISAMRVQKYEDKGYKVSKPEWVKILLTCANLKIYTYEQLKSQIGGMYGINYDKLIKPLDNEEFDLAKAISKLSDLSTSDDYFKLPEVELPDDIEDIIYDINGDKRKVFKLNDEWFEVIDENDFESVCYNSNVPDRYDVVSASDVIKLPFTFYKVVQKTRDKYLSFFDDSFEYKIGEVAVACKNKSIYDNSYGIYGNIYKYRTGMTYYGQNNSAVLELQVDDINDFLSLDSLRVNKAKVIREVPKEEIKQ